MINKSPVVPIDGRSGNTGSIDPHISDNLLFISILQYGYKLQRIVGQVDDLQCRW